DTRDYETNCYLVMVTKHGQAKKTEFKEYDSKYQSLIAIKLVDGDELVSVRTTNGENDILIFTKNGMGIRFAESELRAMGRGTQGVRGMKSREGDEGVEATSSADGEERLAVTAGGYGRRRRLCAPRRGGRRDRGSAG